MGKEVKGLRRLILRDQTSNEAGYVSPPKELPDYLGQQGVSITPLRPSGSAWFGDKRVDVVTEGDFISANEKVVVIKVDGSSVIVRKLSDTE